MLDHDLLTAPYGGTTIRVRGGGRVLLVRGSSALGIDIFVNKLFFQNRERMVIFFEKWACGKPVLASCPNLTLESDSLKAPNGRTILDCSLGEQRLEVYIRCDDIPHQKFGKGGRLVVCNRLVENH